MAFSDSQTAFRGDLNGLVVEAASAMDNLIATKVFPLLSVTSREGQYPIFKKNKGALLNNDETLRTPGGSYGRVVRAYEQNTYSCVDRGLEELVDDAYKADVARYFNAEATAAKMVLQQMMLGHEIRVAAEVFNTTNFGSATNSATAYTVANKATADFPSDIMAGIDVLQARGEKPNTIVMSNAVLTRIKGQTPLQNFVRGNRPSDITANLSASAIAAAFADQGITQVLVGRAAYNSAKTGQPYSGSNVWSNTYVWLGRVESGDFFNGGAGRTAVWTGDSELFTTETYRDESRRSNVVRVRHNTDELTIDGQAGYLLATQYS